MIFYVFPAIFSISIKIHTTGDKQDSPGDIPHGIPMTSPIFIAQSIIFYWSIARSFIFKKKYSRDK